MQLRQWRDWRVSEKADDIISRLKELFEEHSFNARHSISETETAEERGFAETCLSAIHLIKELDRDRSEL